MAQRQFRSDDTSIWQERWGGGGAGALSVTSGTTTISYPANVSCSGTAGATSLTVASTTGFNSSGPILIHQSRGTTNSGPGFWELNFFTSAGGGALTLKYPLINTYTDSGGDQAQVLELPQYNSVSVTGGTLQCPAWDENVGGILAFLCTGSVTVGASGTISVKGADGNNGFAPSSSTGGGYRGGDAASSSNAHSLTGEGDAGTRLQQAPVV